MGIILLTISVAVFALSTMLAFPYYGTKCFSFVFGARRSNLYNWFYVLTIPLGATATLGMVIGAIDGAYALMAFPNMIAALLLSPAVLRAARDYFRRLKNNPDG
ncbi:MAG: hypothetical protein EHM46_04415 [Bacteroidetes bacterium]|nr:MAG: hypothetical protein EHM46_04415 [Bacteroidota bacterium]